jgi:DNA repair exonuclease SbcCD ATPase subunit
MTDLKTRLENAREELEETEEGIGEVQSKLDELEEDLESLEGEASDLRELIESLEKGLNVDLVLKGEAPCAGQLSFVELEDPSYCKIDSLEEV